MNQDSFRPFGDHFSATAEDFKASESYRWVRWSIWLLMFGYVLLLPLIAGFVYSICDQEMIQRLPTAYLLAFLSAGSLVLTVIILGSVLLIRSPAEDERAAAKRFLVAYIIAIVSGVLSIGFGFGQLDIVRRIATAYGSFYFVAYFPVLAANRDNESLTWWSNFTNRFLVILVVVGIGLGILAGMKVIPTHVSIAVFSVAAAVLYVAWMKTLWHGLEATRPVAKDFEPKQWPA